MVVWRMVYDFMHELLWGKHREKESKPGSWAKKDLL